MKLTFDLGGRHGAFRIGGQGERVLFELFHRADKLTRIAAYQARLGGDVVGEDQALRFEGTEEGAFEFTNQGIEVVAEAVADETERSPRW